MASTGVVKIKRAGGAFTIEPTINAGDDCNCGSASNTNSVESLLGLNSVVRIELDGSGAGADTHGLSFNSGGGSEVRGLVVNRFARSGIRLVVFNGDNTVVAGNLIGTDASGTVDLGNGAQGVLLEGLIDGNSIGGTAAADRNLISGNNLDGVVVGDGSSLTQILGNLIGTDITGARDLGNSRDGVSLPNNNFHSVGNVIGGAVAGSRNIISGNDNTGIQLFSGQRDRLLKRALRCEAMALEAELHELFRRGRGDTN